MHKIPKTGRSCLSLTLLFLLLSVASCDRYKHTFEPVVPTNYQTELFTPLATAFGTITAADVQPVMAFYTDDYLHNGQTKADRENWFVNLLQNKAVSSFEVTLLNVVQQSDTLALAKWQFRALDNANQAVADSIFTGDKVVKRGRGWYLKGNQVSCCIVTPHKRVFIEYFTYRTCTYCPAVEALLDEMQTEHPNDLTYLEYHVNDEMDIGNLGIYGYYGYVNPPVAVFQGMTRIQGANPDNEANFNALYNTISNQDSEINFTNLTYGFNGQVLEGSIRLMVDNQNINLNQCKLKYAILDKESTYNNAAGLHCRNVVRAKGETSLNGVNPAQPVSFNLPFSVTLPADSYLALWVQTMPDPFANNATIYNGIETPLTITK